MKVSLRVGNVPELPLVTYELLIATLGYESRATQVASILGTRAQEVVALDYASHHVHAYSANKAFFESHQILMEPSSAIRKCVSGLVETTRSQLAEIDDAAVPCIAVDFSCMDRDRLASVVLALTIDQSDPLIVDFFYSHADFSEELVGSEGTVLVNRPIEDLEGWPTDPDAGLVALIGLGFEGRLALAATETLEPSQTIALVPRAPDSRYDDVVLSRNQELLNANDGIHAHDYSVVNILETLLDLNASVEALARRARVVMVPLGPKPLALCAILTAVSHPQDVTVWRMSADEGRTPEDRSASGAVSSLRVLIGRSGLAKS